MFTCCLFKIIKLCLKNAHLHLMLTNNSFNGLMITLTVTVLEAFKQQIFEHKMMEQTIYHMYMQCIIHPQWKHS